MHNLFFNYTLAHIEFMCLKPLMDRKKLMETLASKAFDERITLPDICFQAGLSPTIAYRFMNDGNKIPTLKTIGRMERAFAELQSQ